MNHDGDVKLNVLLVHIQSTIVVLDAAAALLFSSSAHRNHYNNMALSQLSRYNFTAYTHKVLFVIMCSAGDSAIIRIVII